MVLTSHTRLQVTVSAQSLPNCLNIVAVLYCRAYVVIYVLNIPPFILGEKNGLAISSIQ